MSTGLKVPFADALHIAEQLVADLRPVCERVKVVGSLRRKRPQVGDVEILLEPRMVTSDLFGSQMPDLLPIRAVAYSWGGIEKAGERMLSIRTAMQALKVELYMVHPPANWFVLLAIRTGPATLGKEAVTRMHQFGRRCDGGRIIDKRTGYEWPCNCEEDFFRAAGLPCLPPARRDTPEAMRGV